jgi:formate-dependent nitrite reductase cytochrome c552 subunit
LGSVFLTAVSACGQSFSDAKVTARLKPTASEHVGSLACAECHKEADRDSFNAELRKHLIVQLIEVKDNVNARAEIEDYVQRLPADSFMRRLLARVQLMGQPK